MLGFVGGGADVGGIFLFWLIWMVMVEMTQLGVLFGALLFPA